MKKKEKSWTRIDYERAYRLMRSEIEWDLRGKLEQITEEILHAADYAFQAYGHEPTGWINKRRHKRFLEIKWRVLTQREELPF